MMVACAWMLLVLLLALLSIASNVASSPPSAYPVDEYFFQTKVDHFNFRPIDRGNDTFPLRYYVNQDFWNQSSAGPCFFYAGNEADIFQFINNSGFMFESARELGALIVFAEHRYYGKSYPFGSLENALGKGYNISFLTVEQAMADFHTLSLHIRKEWSMLPQTAFIVWGGSYGANLALWMRLKNPNLWAGAIASSATPLKHLLRETNGFAAIETQAYGNVSLKCPDLIRKGWKELFVADPRTLQTELGLCDDDDNSFNNPWLIHGWISDALETMVQYGYPYPNSFYSPVPGYPFRVACQRMLQTQSQSHAGLKALRAAVNVYFNFTGQQGSCYSADRLVNRQGRQYWIRRGRHDVLLNHASLLSEDDDDDDPTSIAWGYQTCTEVFQPMPTNGLTDFEIPYTPNWTAIFEYCQSRWDVTPRPFWEEMTFMGDRIGSTGSNIFLTNGQLDPWRAAGIVHVKPRQPPSIQVRFLQGAAHHLDLRASHPLDPPSVVQVRREQIQAIKAWVAEWKQRDGNVELLYREDAGKLPQ